MQLDDLVQFLDKQIGDDQREDSSVNGLQVANSGTVSTVGLAVDAALATFERAAEAGVDCLIVHHGLFWQHGERIVNELYSRVQFLLQNDMALYAQHLPLDAHPVYGNNARLLAVLGAEQGDPFAEVGFLGHFPSSLAASEVEARVKQELGIEPLVWFYGAEHIATIAVLAGAGIKAIQEAYHVADLFLTGEPSHAVFHQVRERCFNLITAGHYATETLGVQAVGQLIQQELALPAHFIDIPTGL